MADIFRLLSRSTSFAKGAGSTAVKSDSNPDRQSSKKRKADNGTLPEELDFFNASTRSAPTTAATVTTSTIPQSEKSGESPQEPPLDPSEIKPFLRKHKLKFTLITPNTTPTIESGKKKRELFIPPLTSFSNLHISSRLHGNIADRYHHPTPVQMGALPVLMSRDSHLLCCAPTGSGKTLAYMVPLLDWILRTERGRARAVVVAPTRELASQIVNETKKLALGIGVRVSLVKKGAVGVRSEVLVATPAVLLHSIERGEVAVDGVERLVLDEADVLLDELFREQTIGLWNALKKDSLRCSLFSATINTGTEDVALTHLPPSHQETIRLTVGIKNTAISTVTQSLLYTATEPGKLLALRQLFATSLHPPILIFLQTISRATALLSELTYDLPATPGKIAVLHSDLPSQARTTIMSRFLSGDIWVLITTDLLARGIDFSGVRMVVNYDIPTSVAGYIHRVGRTGRAGKAGEAVTYYTKDDVAYVKGIANVIALSKKAGGASGGDGDNWLLNALPRTSKKDKDMLKKGGVPARSGGKVEARISTKSGWERNKERNRRGAVEGSKRRKIKALQEKAEAREEGEEGVRPGG